MGCLARGNQRIARARVRTARQPELHVACTESSTRAPGGRCTRQNLMHSAPIRPNCRIGATVGAPDFVKQCARDLGTRRSKPCGLGRRLTTETQILRKGAYLSPPGCRLQAACRWKQIQPCQARSQRWRLNLPEAGTFGGQTTGK